MARILGIDLPKEKRIEIALQYIYGIGPAIAVKILTVTGIDLNKRSKDLTEDEIAKIVAVIQKNYVVEGDLRREVNQNIRQHMDMGSYRGLRHRKGLPCRGQRTRTNSRTRKGRKQTVGGMKKKEEK
ncbi:MAG: 30S ribosomal protein S13 [Candidatus Omnitrophica bacterium]|nr:30S ribosomal protein S13 [Candidatus Omnitrophota bacterium]